MVRQEEIRGLNAHFKIHLVGLGIDKPRGWDESLLRRRRLRDCSLKALIPLTLSFLHLPSRPLSSSFPSPLNLTI